MTEVAHVVATKRGGVETAWEYVALSSYQPSHHTRTGALDFFGSGSIPPVSSLGMPDTTSVIQQYCACSLNIIYIRVS